MPDIFVSNHSSVAPTSPPAASPVAGVSLPKLRVPQARFLRSFLRFPQNLRFDTQDQKEHIVLLLRQHPLVNVPWILLALVLLLTPLLLSFFLTREILPPVYRLLVVILWYLFTLAYIFERFLLWYYNVYLVTDLRLVDIDFPSLLYREMTEARLDHV